MIKDVLKNWGIYSGITFLVCYLFLTEIFTIYYSLLVATLLGGFLAFLLKSKLPKFGLFYKVYLSTLLATLLHFLCEINNDYLDENAILSLSFLFVTFILFLRAFWCFFRSNKIIGITLFILMAIVAIFAMFFVVNSDLWNSDYFFVLNIILFISLFWEFAEFVAKKKKIFAVPVVLALIVVLFAYIKTMDLSWRENLFSEPIEEPEEYGVIEDLIVEDEAAPEVIVSPIKLDTDSLQVYLEEFYSIEKDFNLNSLVFNLASPDYMFNVEYRNDRLLSLNDIGLNLDRNGDKLSRFFAVYKNVFFNLCTSEIYYSSELNSYIEMLLNAYNDYMSFDDYTALMSEINQGIYSEDNPVSVDDIIKEVFRKYHREIEFNLYGESWAYSFWCRRYREQNMKQVYAILQEVNEQYANYD